MDLVGYLATLRRRWLNVLMVALATMALTAVVTIAQTPQYTATTKLFFGVQGSESATDLAQGSNFTEKQMASYAEVATSPLVLDKVVKQLGTSQTSSELAESVSASAPPDTVILEISVVDRDAKTSSMIANSIAEQLSAVAGALSPERSDGSQAVRATILARALIPTSPSSPLVVRYIILGLLVGVLLGMGLAIVRQLLDTRVRSEQDVRNMSSHAVLGTVPFDANAPLHPVVMHDDALGGRPEAVRRLRTNLQFVQVAEETRSMVITSSIPGEGKTTTALNLAVSLADAGLRVILIDADLRRPSIGNYLGMESAVGLTTVLIGKATVADVVQQWGASALDILPAGQVPPNPSELLGSRAMADLLNDLAKQYDRVLLDSPPLLPVTDAAVLSRIAGGTLVVVGADRLHRLQLRSALESLETVGANILGIVINKLAKRETSSYGYGYGYGYESPASEAEAAPSSDRQRVTSSDARVSADATSASRGQIALERETIKR